MTKREYEEKSRKIADMAVGAAAGAALLILDSQYIASLEAENAELIGRIEYIEAKTEKIHNTMYGHGSCNDSAEYVLDNLLLDIVQLNAKKDKLLDILLSRLAPFGCPSGDVLLACDKNSEDNACIACWREYLMQSDDATQKELK